MASANERYDAAEAAAAALIAPDVHRHIIVAARARNLNPSSVGSSVQMRLATFLAPGSDDPDAPARSAATEVVAFASGTVLDRLASGDRTPGRRRGVSRSPR